MNHYNWILWFPSAGTQIRLDTHCIGWFFVEPASSCSAKTFEEGGWSFNTHKLWVSHNPSVYLYIFVWRGREVMANPRVRRESHRRRRLHKGREIHSCFHLWSDAHCSATGSSTHFFWYFWKALLWKSLFSYKNNLWSTKKHPYQKSSILYQHLLSQLKLLNR